MIKGFVILLFSVLINSISIFGQDSEPPSIGKKCPNFTLQNVEHFSRTKLSRDEFQGKWMILEFWGEFCGGCIGSFPHIKELQEKYRDNIQFVLVTKTYKDPNSPKRLYEKIALRLELNLPIAYDNTLFDKFNVNGLPTIIVIAPDGIVKAITYKLTERNIQEFISTNESVTPRSYLLDEQLALKYDTEIPLLIGNNGASENDYLNRSILSRWKPSMSTSNKIITDGRLELIQMPLETLYLFAYFGIDFIGIADTPFYGKFHNRPILNIKDSAFFEPDETTGQNFFCYSTEYPKRGKLVNPYNIILDTMLQERMQRDLKNFFNYDVSIEERDIPYLSLEITQEAEFKLKTKEAKSSVIFPYGEKGGIIAKNISIQTVIRYLYTRPGARTALRDYALLDNTNFKRNFDITIDAIYYNDWIEKLKDYGIQVNLRSKKMRVIVISDPSNVQKSCSF